MSAMLQDPRRLAQSLLDWYDHHRRSLPWRAAPGMRADAYAVWLSEIMLQQTTVATVAPRFADFLERWPTVAALAAAPLDDVLHAWQGLGYYARARNLHKCARTVVADHGGRFPDGEAALRQLPGIGAYTAAAVAAIAFGRPAAAVDGNVERVLARLYDLRMPLPKAKPRLKELAAGLVPEGRPGDFAQALMDLGAMVCRPRKPACGDCPWGADCAVRRAGDPEALPLKAPKKPRPLRRGIAFWIVRPDGAVLLRRRPEQGLLGGMTEVPSTPWRDEGWTLAEALAHAPTAADCRLLPGTVAHTFTHFHLELAVAVGAVDDASAGDGLWVAPSDMIGHALPTVMKKVVRHALGSA